MASGAAVCLSVSSSCSRTPRLISFRRTPAVQAAARANTPDPVASAASLRQPRLPALPGATSSPGQGRNLGAPSSPCLSVGKKPEASRRGRQVTGTAVRSSASAGHKGPQDLAEATESMPQEEATGSTLEEEAPGSTPESTQFEWKSNWYAVAPAQDLDPDRPHPITLLGRRMVLWKDRNSQPAGSDPPSSQPAAHGAPVGHPDKGVFGGESQWKCFLDQCPHRVVPLSEGRIDGNGRLQCSYHGWTFRGDGGCCGIPQANREGPEIKAVGSPRACALSFPVREVKGLLFVWPDASFPARALAARTPLPIPDDMPHETDNLVATARVLPYGYETLAENVVDPSHVPWAHHGVGPFHRSQGATPYKWVTVASASAGVGGFEGESMGSYLTSVQFKAPGMFSYLGRFGAQPSQGGSEAGASGKPGDSADDASADCASAKNGVAASRASPAVPPPQAPGKAAPAKGGGTFASVLFITPVEPGKSRVVVWEGLTGPATTPAWRRLPRWLMHLFKLYLLDGDAFFLHAQERMHGGYVMKKQSSSEAADYFMPTAADRFVVAFRQWLSRYGGGGVLYPREVNVPLSTGWEPKEKVLDRYSSHVQDCTTCQKALATVKLLQKVALALAAVSAVALLLPFLKWNVQVAGLLVGGALGGGCCLLGWLKQQFYFLNYDHATR